MTPTHWRCVTRAGAAEVQVLLVRLTLHIAQLKGFSGEGGGGRLKWSSFSACHVTAPDSNLHSRHAR